MTRRAAKYRRISSDREGRELGIARQDDDLDALAARLSLDVVASYVDNDIGASTRSRKPRPDYKRMLADARAGKFDTILAYTSGRLTRRPREHEDLIELAEEHGMRYQFVASPSFDLNTSAGRRVARILAATDAGESEDISERVAGAALQRAKNGLNHGGRRCYGYTVDGLHLEPGEARQVARMADQLLSGVPLAAIRRDLDRRGAATVTGRPWTSNTIRNLLRSPRLAKLSEHKGQIVGKGQWPAIITEETHHAIVALLADPSRRTTTGNRASYLLSGIATCAVCGQNITSAGVKKGGAPTRYVYRCRTNACVARRRDWVDEFVAAVIVERLSRKDARDLLARQDTAPDVAAVRRESMALRVRLDELADAFADGTVTKAQLVRGTAKIRARLDELEAAQLHVSRAPVLAGLVGVADVRNVWDGLSLDRQRAVVETLVTVRLHPGGGGQRTFDPTKVEVTWRQP